MPPTFLRQARRERLAEAVERVETAALQPQVQRPANPFVAAADDLAARWDEMVRELEMARTSSESHHAENVHLRERVQGLERELEATKAAHELELSHQTGRADRAVAELAETRAKFALIRDSLSAVLDQDRDLDFRPRRGESIERHVEQHDDGDDEDDDHLREIVSRLPPPPAFGRSR